MKKPTLTIGIPAYNEESNILNVLGSIDKQTSKNFSLSKIIVLNDCSSDNTAELVEQFAKKNKKVVLVDDKKRMGKAERLNQLFRLVNSDLLLSLDADLVLKNTTTLEELVAKMTGEVLLVGARLIPVKQKSLMGKLSVVSYLTFEDAFFQLNNGKNIYSMVGGAQLIKTSFARTIYFPKKTVSDQNFLYAKAIMQNPKAYAVAKKAEVYVRTVSTFHDWRVLGVRSTVEDKASLKRNLGEEAMVGYYMPRKYLVKSYLKFLLKSPIYTVGSVLMNIFIRKFPYSTKPKNGKWELTLSSKIGILM